MFVCYFCAGPLKRATGATNRETTSGLWEHVETGGHDHDALPVGSKYPDLTDAHKEAFKRNVLKRR